MLREKPSPIEEQPVRVSIDKYVQKRGLLGARAFFGYLKRRGTLENEKEVFQAYDQLRKYPEHQTQQFLELNLNELRRKVTLYQFRWIYRYLVTCQCISDVERAFMARKINNAEGNEERLRDVVEDGASLLAASKFDADILRFVSSQLAIYQTRDDVEAHYESLLQNADVCVLGHSDNPPMLIRGEVFDRIAANLKHTDKSSSNDSASHESTAAVILRTLDKMKPVSVDLDFTVSRRRGLAKL